MSIMPKKQKRSQYDWSQAKISSGETKVKSIFEVIDSKLFQGSVPVDKNIVNDFKLDVVVDLEGDIEPAVTNYDGKFVYVYWPIANCDTLPDQQQLRALAKYVVSLIQIDKRVLICCAHGVNRSALLSSLVLMHYYKWNSTQAINYLKARNSTILTNKVFNGFILSYKVD